MYFALASLGVAVGAFVLATIIKVRENNKKEKEKFKKKCEKYGIKFYRLKNWSIE